MVPSLLVPSLLGSVLPHPVVPEVFSLLTAFPVMGTAILNVWIAYTSPFPPEAAASTLKLYVCSVTSTEGSPELYVCSDTTMEAVHNLSVFLDPLLWSSDCFSCLVSHVNPSVYKPLCFLLFLLKSCPCIDTLLVNSLHFLGSWFQFTLVSEFKVKVSLFVTYTIIQGIISSEM